MSSPPPLENAACPVCNSRDFAPLETLRDRLWSRPGTFQMARCNSCSHGFLQLRPSIQNIGFYYDGLYDEGGLEIEERLQRSTLARLLNWRRLRALDARMRGKRGPHLDVGCGVSSLLRQIAGRGREVAGLDFDPAAVESQRVFCDGLKVRLWRGTLELASDESEQEVNFAGEKFASVSMIHYLEHTFSPIEDLARTFDLLEPGGAIVVEVPSIESFNRRVYRSFWLPYLPPQHLSLFSRRSLKRALEDAGFSGVRILGASAPFIGLSSFLIWWTWNFGRKSRVPKSLRPLLLPVAILLGLMILSFDLSSFWWLAKTGRADHLRATGTKKAAGF
jgi:2-polyprenyl-3-methyl-5-hydroxy-6-metoxy-1,4-benzoquinol methylase